MSASQKRHYRADQDELARSDDWRQYNDEIITAVEQFRSANALATANIGSPRGLVDQQLVDALWQALESIGKANLIRERLLDLTAVRR